MSIAVAPRRGIVEHFTSAQLEARKSKVTAEIERRFGSLENALDLEETGVYGSDEQWLFSEYHSVRYLLGEE